MTEQAETLQEKIVRMANASRYGVRGILYELTTAGHSIEDILWAMQLAFDQLPYPYPVKLVINEALSDQPVVYHVTLARGWDEVLMGYVQSGDLSLSNWGYKLNLDGLPGFDKFEDYLEQRRNDENDYLYEGGDEHGI